ncbi:MAG: hypothetical protein GX352_01100 [Clostridiales bacterium]|nr:hypothetical protein [Clostridiales bacterium]
MKEIVDLSGPIVSGLWGYYSLPGLEDIVPQTKIEHIAYIEKEGFFSSMLHMSTLTGSYVEGGSHILKDGKNVNDYSVEDFIKPAKVLHVKGVGPKGLVTTEKLEEAAKGIIIDKKDALLIDTGYGVYWDKENYVIDGPNYTPSALEWIIEKDPSIFGVDVPCIEGQWSEGAEEGKGDLLAKLFNNDTLLVAPLVNLDKIKSSSGTVFCLPINVKGISGAPGRVVFIGE